MRQVCSLCYKCTREKHEGVRTQFSSASSLIHNPAANPQHQHQNNNQTSQQSQSFEPPPKKRKSSRASVEILTDPDQSLMDEDERNGAGGGGTTLSPADIECILCRRKFTVHSFKYLNSVGPPLGGIPYFPFLRTLHRLNDELGELIVNFYPFVFL